ncbi:hypothetical protein M5U04_14935 [Xenorhabdus sp. XENO-1]|nr:hypothetical protein [Xenorhabdus bovienii subsp. africana]
MKRVNCKKCQGEVAQNEQICPHCGEKISKGLKPQTIIAITIGIMVCAATFHIVSNADLTNSYAQQTASNDESHFSFKKIHEMVTGPFYTCLTQNYSTKPGKLKPDEILACDEDFRKYLSTPYDSINLDNFISNFSRTNNAYKPLEKAIKRNMFDVSSYQHIETTYRLALNQQQQQPYAVVHTVFKGKSIFERIEEDYRTAKVDIKTGEIIAYIPKVTVSDEGQVIVITDMLPE